MTGRVSSRLVAVAAAALIVVLTAARLVMMGSKVDFAVRTVDDYRARLRDEVETDTVAKHPLTAVQATVQPTRTSSWLRAPRMQA